MAWFDRFSGSRKGPDSPSRSKQEYVLIIESPQFGPVGEERLRAIMKHVRSRLNGKYGHLFRSTQPMASLAEGSISMKLETTPLTTEQAKQIVDFGTRCFQELVANPMAWEDPQDD